MRIIKNKKLRVAVPTAIAAASVAVALTACADPHGTVVDRSHTPASSTYGYHGGHWGYWYTPASWTLEVQDGNGNVNEADVNATEFYDCPPGAAFPACEENSHHEK